MSAVPGADNVREAKLRDRSKDFVEASLRVTLQLSLSKDHFGSVTPASLKNKTWWYYLR